MASRNLIEIVIGVKNLASGDLDRFQRKLEQSAAAWRKIGYASLGAGAAGLTTIGLMTRRVVTQADEINRLSKIMGVSAEEYQRLTYAAEQSESSGQAVVKGVSRITIATAEATQGNKTFQAGFDKLGISYKDNEGKARSGIDVLLDLADRFHRGKLSSEEYAAGLSMIGVRGGQDLIPFLKEGKERILAMMAAAPGIIPDETIASLDTFGDYLKGINKEIGALLASGVKELIPFFTSLGNSVEGVVSWFSDLSPQAKSAAAGTALFGLAGLVAAGNMIILAATMRSVMFVTGLSLGAFLAFGVAVDLVWRILGVGIAIIGKVAEGIGHLIGVMSKGKHGAALEAWGKSFKESGKEEVKKGFGGNILEQGASLFPKRRRFSQSAIDKAMERKELSLTPALAGGPTINPQPTYPGNPFGGGYFSLPPLGAQRAVSQAGQRIDLHISVDSSAQAVEEFNNFLQDHGYD